MTDDQHRDDVKAFMDDLCPERASQGRWWLENDPIVVHCELRMRLVSRDFDDLRKLIGTPEYDEALKQVTERWNYPLMRLSGAR